MNIDTLLGQVLNRLVLVMNITEYMLDQQLLVSSLVICDLYSKHTHATSNAHTQSLSLGVK